MGVEVTAISLVEGANFSGRTGLLREAVLKTRNEEGKGVTYIGPEVFTSFSGLAATVRSELELVDEGLSEKLISALGLMDLMDREMFTLSGGEEVLCSIAAGLAFGPEIVALDCVLEQLDARRRCRALDVLKGWPAREILLADNRAREWTRFAEFGRRSPELSPAGGRFGPINGAAAVPPSEGDPSDIIISNLHHRYGTGRYVLNGIEVNFRAGVLVHLVGENGAGKSTLAKILVGALRASSGSVTHRGFESATWERPGRLASYSFQNPDAQLLRTTVRAELASGAKVAGRAPSMVSALVDSAAEAFGLTEILGDHPHELPFSMRKRVALAATFACGTPWMILDEPTLGQDDDSVEQLARYICRVCQAGRGIVIISHSKSFMRLLSAEQFTISHGKIWREGPAADR